MVGWWIGNALGVLVLVPVVILLANRVIRPAREAARYSEDILVHGVGITSNLVPVPALLETRSLVGVALEKAAAYVSALRKIA